MKIIASVVIPTFNRCDILKMTLLSLLGQTLDRGLFEVIIVDDGSDDGTKEMINDFKVKLNITYIFQEHIGRRVSLARNRGVELARGEVCIFVDSGVILSTRCIQEHIATHQKSNEGAVVLGYIYGFSEDNHDSELLKSYLNSGTIDETINELHVNGLLLDPREKFYRIYNDVLETLPAPWVFFWTSNISARRSDLVEVGLFDINYDPNWGNEDIDLGYRLHRNGIRTYLSRDAAAVHFPHERDYEKNNIERKINENYFVKKFPNPEIKLFIDVTWDLNEYLIR